MRGLPKEIRRTANLLAHRMMLKHGDDVRRSLLTQLQEAAAAGATTASLTAMLNRIRLQHFGEEVEL